MGATDQAFRASADAPMGYLDFVAAVSRRNRMGEQAGPRCPFGYSRSSVPAAVDVST